MAWNEIPEFDSASSSQDDNPFTEPDPLKQEKCLLKFLSMTGFAENLKS